MQFPDLASHNPKTVGAPSTSRFAKFEHPRKMLSLGNLFTNEDVERFARPIFEAGDTIIIEPKYDGLSVALHYTLGGLGAAVTRGDGSVGDLVTENVKRVQGVPLQLRGDDIPTNVEVRGEVYMSYQDFEAVNAERAAAGEKLFANPRNAAVGALKSSDPEEVARRRLSFVAYDLQDWEKHGIEHIGAQYDRLLMHGFKTPLWAHADSDHALLDQISAARERRKKWPFPTDGVVIKATRHTTRIALGTGTTGPNWAAAFKYPPTQVRTKLLAIDVQIGRTGVLTPVARLEPVQLDGTVVSNATLHNFDEVARKDIRVGDIVVIEKAGEIIPIVVEVDMEARSQLVDVHTAKAAEMFGVSESEVTAEMRKLGKLSNFTAAYGPSETTVVQTGRSVGKTTSLLVHLVPYQDRYVPPTHCPHCNSPTVKDKSALRCSNPTCKGRVLQQLVYFVSKAAMDIQHVGEALLESLVGQRLNSPADLYTLAAADITAHYTDGSKIAARALASIEASKSQPAWRVLAGLGIPGVGSNTSKQLLKVYESIEALSVATEESLRECEGIGEVTAADIVAWFRDRDNDQMWLQLVMRHGLQGIMEKKAPASERLDGQVWVITGTLSRERGDFANFLENHGAKVGSGVTSKTTHLLVGDKPGASKTSKAAKLKLSVVTEAEIHPRQAPQGTCYFSPQLEQTLATTSIRTSGNTSDIASSIVALTN